MAPHLRRGRRHVEPGARTARRAAAGARQRPGSPPGTRGRVPGTARDSVWPRLCPRGHPAALTGGKRGTFVGRTARSTREGGEWQSRELALGPGTAGPWHSRRQGRTGWGTSCPATGVPCSVYPHPVISTWGRPPAGFCGSLSLFVGKSHLQTVLHLLGTNGGTLPCDFRRAVTWGRVLGHADLLR